MTTSINNFFGKTIPYLLLALVFFMPINIKFAIPFISIIAFSWLLSGDWLEIIKNLRNNKVVLFLAVFWILHVVGLLYTNNMYYGLVDLQQKLSFIVFPIFFISSSHRIVPFKKWFFIFFLFGGFLSGIYLIGNAFYLSISFENGAIIFNTAPPDAWWENYFRYNRLSVFHHTSYLAMYYSFSIAIFFSYIKGNKVKWEVVIYILGIIFFYTLIILLSSKAGILVATLTIIIGVLWLFFKKYGVISLIVAFLFLLISGYLLSQYNWRFVKFNDNIETIVNNNKNDQDEKKVDMRIQIWKSIPSIINRDWIFGFGTGDTKDELVAGYKRLNLNIAAKEELNTHNQYLETIVAIGLPGFLLLLFMLLYPVYQFIKGNIDFLSIIFIGIVSINLLFESMLVRIAGVMFFAVFYCIFFAATPKRKYDYH